MSTKTPAKIELSPTSYIVLGLLSAAGQATPYDLKRMVSLTVGHFWSLPHSSVYTEPARLADAGYLTEEREPSGRRRKLYAITDAGREAFAEWVAQPTGELMELRDLALLKLFFGADPAALAQVQLRTNRGRLAEYEAIREAHEAQAGDSTAEAVSGPELTLQYGLRHLRDAIAFWSDVAGET